MPSVDNDLASSGSLTEWNADPVLYRLQPLPPLQHPLLAGQRLLHRAPPRPAAGGQHQAGVQGQVDPAVEALGARGAEPYPARYQLLLCFHGSWADCPASPGPGPALGWAEDRCAPCHRKPCPPASPHCRTIPIVNPSSTATWLKHHLFIEVQATVCIDLMYLFPLWAPGMRAEAASDPQLYLCHPSKAHGGHS